MGDPWRVKYDGICSRCGVALRKGEPAVWERNTRSIRCIECPIPQPPPPPALVRTPQPAPPPLTPLAPPPIDGPGVAGRSARTEYERRAAKRETAITNRWGTGMLSKVVRVISPEPQSTRAWAIGAAGEEQLAAELGKVPGLRMLHDRRVPRTRGNIDHIVIGPAGIFVVDAKNNHGSIGIRDRGSIFRSDDRLVVGGRDCSAMADKMGWQVDAVRAALVGQDIDPVPPITPVLCFLSVEWPLFWAPDVFRGVRLEGPRSIKRLLGSKTVLEAHEADELLAALARALPPK